MRSLIIKLAAPVLAMAVLLASSPAWGQISNRDQKFLEALQQRGLMKLVEQYLEDQEKLGADPSFIKEQQARLFDMNGTRQSEEAARDRLFGKAREKYNELLGELDKQMQAETDQKAKDALHIRILKIKIRLGEMLWQRQANSQLTVLELTDRQAGAKLKLQKLLQEATTLFTEVDKDVTEWRKAMEASPDFAKTYAVTYEETGELSEYPAYQKAWTSYYLAYVLPVDSKERPALLKYGIDKFGEFAKTEDDVQAKWESTKGLGLCQREDGKYEQALDSLRKAMTERSPESFKITCYYELTQTYMMAKKYPEARGVLTELRGKNFASLDQTFVGAHLLPFLEARIGLAESQTDAGRKKEALKQMKALWDQGEFWHILVSAEVGKYINKTQKAADMEPFELWILADQTFRNSEFEQAAKYFQEYCLRTDPKDETHRQGVINQGGCYKLLGDGLKGAEKVEYYKKAMAVFADYATKFPADPKTPAVNQTRVALATDIYKENPTDANLEVLNNALKQGLATGGAAEANDMGFLQASVLQTQKKFLEAAAAYHKVSTDSPNYYDALFKEPYCYREELLQNAWQRDALPEVKRLAATTVTKMEEYVAKVEKVRDAGDAAEAAKLRTNAAQMLVWAAEILAQDKIQEFQRSLDLIARYEKQYSADQSDLMGEALKVKIDCYVGQGKPEMALNLLQALMKTYKGDETQQVIKRLFASITDEVDRLIKQSRLKEAQAKVAFADEIGKAFIDFLGKQPKGIEEVPLVYYELADLHMRAEDFEGPNGSIARFLGLIKFDPAEREAGKNDALDVNYLNGLAQSTYLMGQKKARDGKEQEAYDTLKKSVKYLSLVADGWKDREAKTAMDKQAAAQEEPKRKFWESKLNEMQAYLTLDELEKKFGPKPPTDYLQTIKDFLQFNTASGSSFGGPGLKLQFQQIAQRVGVTIK